MRKIVKGYIILFLCFYPPIFWLLPYLSYTFSSGDVWGSWWELSLIIQAGLVVGGTLAWMFYRTLIYALDLIEKGTKEKKEEEKKDGS